MTTGRINQVFCEHNWRLRTKYQKVSGPAAPRCLAYTGAKALHIGPRFSTRSNSIRLSTPGWKCEAPRRSGTLRRWEARLRPCVATQRRSTSSKLQHCNPLLKPDFGYHQNGFRNTQHVAVAVQQLLSAAQSSYKPGLLLLTAPDYRSNSWRKTGLKQFFALLLTGEPCLWALSAGKRRPAIQLIHIYIYINKYKWST